MPSLQVVDLSPTPRQEPTALELTLQGFSQRLSQNKEADILKKLQQQYKEENLGLQEMIERTQTEIGLSPTTRVNSINQLLDMERINIQRQNAAARAEKQNEKEINEKKYGHVAADILTRAQKYNWSGTKTFAESLHAGIPLNYAKEISTKLKQDINEDRYNSRDIRTIYNAEIKALRERLKTPLRKSDQEEIENRIIELDKMKNEDLAKARRLKSFVPQIERLRIDESRDRLEDDEEDQEEEQFYDQLIDQSVEEDIMEEEEKENVILQELAKEYPPKDFKDKTFWIPADPELGIEKYKVKSDGERWIIVG